MKRSRFFIWFDVTLRDLIGEEAAMIATQISEEVVAENIGAVRIIAGLGGAVGADLSLAFSPGHFRCLRRLGGRRLRSSARRWMERAAEITAP